MLVKVVDDINVRVVEAGHPLTGHYILHPSSVRRDITMDLRVGAGEVVRYSKARWTTDKSGNYIPRKEQK